MDGFAERYRALSSRDARFDGRFVAAVRTTGIYCRPSCPARTPRPANVEFFATSAAAHLAGYRACRRCLPEAVPGSPDWNLRHDVAARAMRLIVDGVVDREGVAGLAARLGYTTRQLNRHLLAEFGAGPLALARAQRAQNARHLLVAAPALSISDVAFAAGFSSVRQFNDTIAQVYGLTPSAVRALGRVRERGGHGMVRVLLAHRQPLDADGVIDWFSERALPGVEQATANGYARVVSLGGRPAVIAVSTTTRGLSAGLRVRELGDLPLAMARARRLFDLDADPVAVDRVLGADPLLAPLVDAVPGIRIPGAVDLGEMLVRAMVGQQITVVAARTQLTRLVAALGEPVPPALAGSSGESTGVPTLTHAFPSMAAVADGAADVLTGPRARIDAIRAAAAELASGALAPDLAMTREELTTRLTALKGIGPWTADYVSMRYLGHPDVLVRGDVAIARGARRLGLDGQHLPEFAARLAPWRSYLSLHLWRLASRKDHP